MGQTSKLDGRAMGEKREPAVKNGPHYAIAFLSESRNVPHARNRCEEAKKHTSRGREEAV